MKNILFTFALFTLVLIPVYGHAEIPPVQKYVKNAEKSDTARLKYMIWNVYDATLFTSNGAFKADKPFALQLEYLVDLKGAKIAERSIVEMRKQGFNDEEKLSIWEKQLKEIFPDVDKGSSITGIRDAKGNTIFYKNNSEIGQIKNPEFTQSFFDIWLSPKTSEPEMRQQLLGLK